MKVKGLKVLILSVTVLVGLTGCGNKINSVQEANSALLSVETDLKTITEQLNDHKNNPVDFSYILSVLEDTEATFDEVEPYRVDEKLDTRYSKVEKQYIAAKTLYVKMEKADRDKRADEIIKEKKAEETKNKEVNN